MDQKQQEHYDNQTSISNIDTILSKDIITLDRTLDDDIKFIETNETRLERTKLLQELSQLGYHSSGRKQRADRGKSRGAIKQPVEKDKSKMGIYQRVKSRIFNKDLKLKETTGYGTFLEVDENSFYCLIPARYRTVGHSYDQKLEGRSIHHTVKKVRVQSEIDLEFHRFNAYKEKALLTPNEKVQEKYWPEIRQMLNMRYSLTGDEATQALKKRQITWEELFCEFYFLSKDDYWQWDYRMWKHDYELIPVQLLPEDFTFNLQHSPGSEEFHPEWAYKADERKEQIEEERRQRKERKANQFIYNMKRRKT